MVEAAAAGIVEATAVLVGLLPGPAGTAAGLGGTTVEAAGEEFGMPGPEVLGLPTYC